MKRLFGTSKPEQPPQPVVQAPPPKEEKVDPIIDLSAQSERVNNSHWNGMNDLILNNSYGAWDRWMLRSRQSMPSVKISTRRSLTNTEC